MFNWLFSVDSVEQMQIQIFRIYRRPSSILLSLDKSETATSRGMLLCAKGKGRLVGLGTGCRAHSSCCGWL